MNVQERQDGARRTKFARAPRRAVQSSPKQRLELVARLHADPRFLKLKPRAKYCLALAVGEFADGEGKWWHKVKTWAAAAGVHPSTVQRAIREAEAAQLLTRTPYMRPDGFQGSTTYTLDPALLVKQLVSTSSGSSEAPCREGTRSGRPAAPEQENNHNRSKRELPLESENQDHAVGKTTPERDPLVGEGNREEERRRAPQTDDDAFLAALEKVRAARAAKA